jgi:hypothetical protein
MLSIGFGEDFLERWKAKFAGSEGNFRCGVGSAII